MVPPSAMRVVEVLAAHPGVERIRLFGSRARGDHDPTSDVDFAVDEAATLSPFDLVWTDEAPDALRSRIDAEGVTLYDRENAAAPR